MRLLSFGLLLLLASCTKTESKNLSGKLVGAGATFPEPLYTKWIQEFSGVEKNLSIEYTANGSAAGIRSFTENTVDFGATDVPLNDDQLTSTGKVIHIPTTLGCVAVVFHLRDVGDELKITPEALAGIYLGEITKWNDPQLTAQNPGVALPDKPIGAVFRTDGSGTTKVFTEYLSRVSAPWKEKHGSKMQVTLPYGLGALKSDGVARMVQNTNGALGYVELSYAKSYQLQAFAVKNTSGKFVAPSIDGMTSAAQDAKLPDDLRVSLLDSARKDAYPITSFSYIVFAEDQKDPQKSAALKGFLWWAIHDGQRYAPVLGYGTLPPEVVSRAEAKLK